jgi:hypothetical protein
MSKDISGTHKIWILAKNLFQASLIISLAINPTAKWHVPMAMVLLGLIFCISEVNEERLELKLKVLKGDLNYLQNKIKQKGLLDGSESISSN